MRLDAYLALRLHKYSRARVQKIIDEGRVTRSDRIVKAAARVAWDEVIVICYPKTAEPPVPHDVMPILYRDEAMIIINKPGGTLSHPTDKVLHNAVTTILTRQLGAKVFLAHRLDRETSGALVLALDPDSARSLYEQFVDRTIEKEYLAVVVGAVPWTQLLVDAPLGPEGGEIRVRQAVGAGQPAVTDLHKLKDDGDTSLISARPKTGRLHQIRAHLAHIGHPVVGDKLYIGRGQAYMKAVRREMNEDDLKALGADRQLLHAWKLTLNHPRTGSRMTFTAPVPDDFPLKPEENA